MDYPKLALLSASTPQREHGIVPVRATNGKLMVRRFYSADKMNFDLQHWLLDTEYVTLEAHYQAHKTLSFNFYWPEMGQTYVCVYASAPLPTRADGRVLVSVRLMEV